MRVTLPHNAPSASISDSETSISRVPNLPPEEAPENTPAVRRAPSSRRKQSTPPTRSNGTRPSDRVTEPHKLLDAPEPRRGRGALIAACVVFLAVAGLGATVVLGLDGGRLASLWNSALGRSPSGKSSTTSPPVLAEPEAPRPEAAPPIPAPPEPSTELADTEPANPAPSDTEPTTPPSDSDTQDALTDDAQAEKKKPTTTSRRPKRDGDATATPVRKPRTPAAPGVVEDAPTETPEAAAPQGFLTLVTEPSARVSLGNRSLGETPLTKVALPVGRHTLKLMDGTGRPLKLLVEIKPDDTTSVRVPLELLANP
ncbi:MAG: PEGA domain-containing protein [Myxococcaceae bacterium]|nr:MAG: PEGA domain-containing protein [Myxococcaceae bacterium]